MGFRSAPLTAVGVAAALLVGAPAVARAAESSITIDFVRHGEAGANTVIDNSVPGPGLTQAGWGQAHEIADLLGGNHGIDAIFTSGMTRAQQTAAPLATALGLNVPPGLAGLNEIDAGIFADLPVKVGGLPVGAVAYAAAPFLWTLGLYSVPQLGATDDLTGLPLTGMAFQDQFGGAMQTVYDASATSVDTDHVAVFSHEAAIAMWALMNADNPDYLLMAQLALTDGELLPYGGVVEMTGSPADGWSLVSWAGHPVERATLPVDLFVDARELITAPQMAVYRLIPELFNGDVNLTLDALERAAVEIGSATLHFPFAVTGDIADTLLVPGALVGELDILAGQFGGLAGAVLGLL